MKNQTLLATGLLTVSLSAVSHAALSITNGDFETGPLPPDFQADVPVWFDRTDLAFFETAWIDTRDGVIPTDTESGLSGEAGIIFSNNAAGTPGSPLAGAYLYQSIGTDGAATTLPLSFDWGNPQDAPPREVGLSVTVFESDGSFVPGNNVDILGAGGVTVLDSVSLGQVFGAAEYTTSMLNLDVSGQTGGELFLRFNNYNPGLGIPDNEDASWTFLDNVAIVPEPSVAMLGGVGFLLLFRRRR